jgi:hypothetical protein
MHHGRSVSSSVKPTRSARCQHFVSIGRAAAGCALLLGFSPRWSQTVAQMPAPAVSSADPIHVGGFGSVVVNSPSGVPLDKLSIDQAAVAALISGSFTPRFAYFAEIDAYSRSRENFAQREVEQRVTPDRLYGEFTASDKLRVRVGQFLTPIGEWNELHVEPLTWTSVRPLTTFRSFPQSIGGALVGGDQPLGGHDFGYALYGGSSLGHQDHDDVRVAGMVGARAAIEVRPQWWIGASVAALRERRPDLGDTDLVADRQPGSLDPIDGDTDIVDSSTRALAGVDARLLIRGAELTGEVVALSALSQERPELGGFVQAAVPVTLGAQLPLFAVARLERYRSRTGESATLGVFGAAYRPSAWLTLKAERQLGPTGSRLAAPGWYASAAVLF